jgi:hypothetical protein
MPPEAPPGNSNTAAAPAKPVGWPRLLLLLALLNAPLFFNGCESQQPKFTLGAAVPFAEVRSSDSHFLPDKLLWFSWPLLLANGLGSIATLWLATRRFGWMNRVAASRWFVGTLIAVALLFNSWLVFAPIWAHAVMGPQIQIAGLIAKAQEGPGGVSEGAQRFAWLLSGRLYYAACVGVLGGSIVAVQLFLRRYFFVRSGPRWQIQLGGLIIVMLVLGTVIGMTVRLLSSP